ncbi:hypothetical protein PCE1_001259 [Barthelona sp. PCE]
MTSRTNSSYMDLKRSGRSQDIRKQRERSRKKGIIIHCFHWMVENGFIDAAKALETASSVNMEEFCLADNLDLEAVVKSFEVKYEQDYGKFPTLFRARDPPAPGEKKRRKRPNPSKRSASNPPANNKKKEDNGPLDLGVEATKVTSTAARHKTLPGHSRVEDVEEKNEFFENRVLKPLPQHMFGGSDEFKVLVSAVQREIIQTNPNITFNHIIGQKRAKLLLNESLILPIRFPSLFSQGLRSPWKGLLVYGPPGVGKTLLAKAVATECQATFFNISGSTIVSKYRGESSKLVRILFDLARFYAPSVVFMDEIDSVFSMNSDEHEATRQMVAELLVQMDGVLSDDTNQVFLLAATNHPWNLAAPLIRRLHKRVYTPWPDESDRKAMLDQFLKGLTDETVNLDEISALTEDYTGADLRLLCKEAAMRPVREIMQKLGEMAVTDEEADVDVRQISQDDMKASLNVSKRSGMYSEDRYLKWNESHQNS